MIMIAMIGGTIGVILRFTLVILVVVISTTVAAAAANPPRLQI